MKLEKARLGYVAIFTLCLCGLALSINFLYTSDIVQLDWETNKTGASALALKPKQKSSKYQDLIDEIRDQVINSLREHDKVTEKLWKLEEKKLLEEQEEIHKKETEKLKKEQEEEKKKQEEEKKKQDEKKQKEQEEHEKKIKEEERKKVEEELKNKERDDYHKKLEKIYRQMEKDDEDRLLRKIDLPESDKVNGKFEPSGSKIVIVSGCDKKSIENNRTMFEQGEQNRKEYAEYHGYEYVFVETDEYVVEGDKPNWTKVQALRKVYHDHPDAEWFWWLDVDALIMNTEIDLATHVLNPKVLPERLTYGRPVRDPDYHFTRYLLSKEETNVDEVDVLITHDNMGWNTGSVFFRRSYFTQLLLDLWDDRLLRDKKLRQVEQTALTYLAFNHPEIFKRFGTLPQRLVNAYYAEHWEFQPGDFIVHFAGLVKRRKEYPGIWDESFQNRIRPGQKAQIGEVEATG